MQLNEQCSWASWRSAVKRSIYLAAWFKPLDDLKKNFSPQRNSQIHAVSFEIEVFPNQIRKSHNRSHSIRTNLDMRCCITVEQMHLTWHELRFLARPTRIFPFSLSKLRNFMEKVFPWFRVKTYAGFASCLREGNFYFHLRFSNLCRA